MTFAELPRNARILILGAGSAGQRHARNLSSLGAGIACYDPRVDRRLQMQREFPGAVCFDSVESTLGQGFSGAVVASPPSFHVDQAIECISRDMPVLLEKPVSPDLRGAIRLQRAISSLSPPIMLGYTYRWWPPLLHVRRLLEGGSIGSVRHARIVMSAHLADWHPWERYQDFFMASRELGGGALLDESHFIDVILWLLGMPESVMGRVEHISTLEITTDDNVDMLLQYSNGVRATIHLDLFGRPHRKSITIVGEDGSIECLFDPHIVRECPAGAAERTTVFSCERNDMFLDEAREYLEVIAGRRTARCSLKDGIAVLRIVEAVRLSSARGRIVSLDEIRA